MVNKQEEDAIPCVVVRESLTRQTKTLMTSRLRWRGAFQNRVIRTGKLENMWISDCPGPTTLTHGVGERRWAVSVTCCVRSIWAHKNMLASSADERQDANGEAAVSVSWFVEEVELVVL